MNPERMDAVVVGTGQGGVPLAKALAADGRKTAIVERDLVGGSCINTGCTPTKTLVAAARVAYLARRASDFGVRTGPVEVDLARAIARKNEVVESFRRGSVEGLSGTEGLELIRGEASFLAPDRIRIRPAGGGGEREITTPAVFLNTGTRPAVPPIEGISEVPFLDNRSALELDALPEHLLVLGGGYIGVEFGQMFRRFGSRVTLIQRGPRLLAREDADVSLAVAAILREDGIEVLLEAETREAAPTPDGIRLRVASAGAERTVSGSHLLVAAGRTPNTAALDLGAAGVACDARGFVRVNERLETGVPGVYALGDVKGGPAFTHISYDDFRILRANLLEGGHATTRGRLVPYVVFMEPQLGRFGPGEDEARAAGRDVLVARLPMSRVARAIEIGETRGFMKALVDPDNGRLLGATVLGVEGGETAAALQIAMMGGLTCRELRDGIFSHPTLAESFNNLFAGLDEAP